MTLSANWRPVVLVVEDEYLIRSSAADMIVEAGYDVVEAGNADEAIAILEARRDIHVVFTDIRMPGSMDGLKLAHFVRGRWPPIKIVATSGHHKFQDGDLPEVASFCLSLTVLTGSPRYYARWWLKTDLRFGCSACSKRFRIGTPRNTTGRGTRHS